MDMSKFYLGENEKPLDRIVDDGGFTGIFRTIGFIGDSLSSGEFESLDKEGNHNYHDMFEYSWGQYIARAAGLTAYNFSRGGMTASEYMNGFAESKGFWDRDKICQAYVMALGVNDIINCRQPIGTTDDINLDDWTKNAKTFAGYYGAIIQRYREMQPKSRFFLVTMVHDSGWGEENNRLIDAHADILYKIAEKFDFCYVIDLAKYGPVYDAKFHDNFFLGGHLNAAGYQFTGKMISSYIDYIIRSNPEDFTQVGFIGTNFYHRDKKW